MLNESGEEYSTGLFFDGVAQANYNREYISGLLIVSHRGITGEVMQGSKAYSMSKVQLKMPPWIASLLKAEGSDWFVLEKEIGEGATIGDLLVELTSSYEGFRKVVFNPDIGKISDQIMVFLNENLLPESDITDAKLNDGDTVMLLPVYTGG